VAENRELHVGCLGHRRQPELVVEQLLQLPEQFQRVSLTPQPVPGEHRCPVGALAEAVHRQRGLGVVERRPVVELGQRGLGGLQLHRVHTGAVRPPQIFGPSGVRLVRQHLPLGDREGLVVAAPRLPGRGSCGPLVQPVETVEIEVGGCHHETVGLTLGDHELVSAAPGRIETATQQRDVGL
jgi:hypothetical protein